MMKERVKAFFVVRNKKGLHTRPSTELVKCASSFKAQVNLVYQDLTVNAKSLLGILMLEGEDAGEAVAGILHLAKNKFNVKY
jgi:phosphocarrier protein